MQNDMDDRKTPADDLDVTVVLGNRKESGTPFSDTGRDRKIIWSAPYAGNIGKYRIYCRYPLYTPAGEFLGTAGFELRFERILQPLLRANTIDPAHELYSGDSINPVNGMLIQLIECETMTIHEHKGIKEVLR